MRHGIGAAAPAGTNTQGGGSVRRLTIIVALGLLLGLIAALRLPEERRARIKKLFFEAREMPFRIFV